MQKEMLEQFQKMSQMTLENFKRLGEANMRISEKLMQEQIALTTSLIKSAAEKTEGAAAPKDFKYMSSQQMEWAQEMSKKVAESCRSSADIMAEAGKVYTTLFENTVKACNMSACCEKPAQQGKGGKAA